MRRTKQEIEDELIHKNNLIPAYRARLRPLEIQAAQKGSNVPPEILTEISTLTEQIRIQEDEILKLDSLAAEGQQSLAEVEYRVILAETWDTPIGRPNVTGSARLELARLKLGLSPERATEIEGEVRIALVKQIFFSIDVSPLLGQSREPPVNMGPVTVNFDAHGESSKIYIQDFQISQNLTISNSLESALRLIGKAIRLDRSTALSLFVHSLPKEPSLDVASFQELLFAENRVWINQNEYVEFNSFLADLKSALF